MQCKLSTDLLIECWVFNALGHNFKDMTREELQNKHGDAICEYCNKNIISKYNIGIGGLCEGQYCEEAQDGYAAENNIELED